MNPDRILIIQTAFIGDVILATAMVEKLAEHQPRAKIDMLVRKGNEGLLKNNPHLGKVLILDKKKNKYLNVLKLIRNIRKSKFDVVINVQRFFTTGLITAFSGASVKIGFDKNPWAWNFDKIVTHQIGKEFNKHEVERNQELIAGLAGNEPGKPRLYPGKEETEMVTPYLKPEFICVSPASVWFTKQFPANKWVEFLDQSDQSLTIYLLGGPEDVALCDALISQSRHPKMINLAGKLNLLQSAALMKHARMNYVNDSAPLHLASAVNAPVTAIYCSTIPEFGFGPLSDNATVLETQEALQCRPCGLHGHRKCPEGHFKCSQIETRKLLETLG